MSVRLIARHAMWLVGGALLLGAAVLPAQVPAPSATPTATPEAPSFSFIQATDSHFGPSLAMPADLAAERGWATWRALAAHDGAMRLGPFGIEAPPPDFIVNTGDVTEFGFPGATTALASAYFEGIDQPQYEVAGNHDNTWVADTGRWRQRHGGLNHTWDHKGVRFIALNSASLQEPLPSFGEESVVWLAGVLENTDAAMPIVLLWHHPPRDSSFASRYDKDRVYDLVSGHHVVVVLCGHSHAVRNEVTYGIPAIHGGSTFGKNAGYAVADVREGRLRMAYRPLDEDAATTPLLDVSLAAVPRPRVAIESPTPWQSFPGGMIALAATLDNPTTATMVRAYAELNDDERIDLSLADGRATGSLDAGRVTNGVHFVRFVFEEDGATSITGVGQHTRSVAFAIEDPAKPASGTAQWRTALGASIQSTPTLFEGRLYVGTNGGEVVALDAESGAILRRFIGKAEVLADVVAWRADPTAPLRLVVGTGAGELLVLDEELQLVARHAGEMAIYSTAVIDDAGVAYVGTNAGDVIAVKVESGELVWRNTDPDYSIEAPVVLAGDKVLVGAWDGYLYAINRADGKTAWKAAGPRNAAEGVNRYYAPADTPPLVIGETVFVADRAYKSGKYNLADGAFGREFVDGAVALGLSRDGQSVAVRRLDKPVSLHKLDGTQVWESTVVAGRNPATPTTNGRAFFVVDHKGLMSAINARNGETVWQYQVTPGQFVFANVTPVDGGAYVAGMDGRVSYVRRNGASSRSPRADDRATSGPLERRRALREGRPADRRGRGGQPAPTPDFTNDQIERLSRATPPGATAPPQAAPPPPAPQAPPAPVMILPPTPTPTPTPLP